MHTTEVFSLSAPAKINLSLKVGDRFANGYHRLATLIAPITVADKVELSLSSETSCCEVELSEEIRAILEEGGAKELESKLSCLRENIAARAVSRILGERSFSLRILKRIPVEAGLGGGSSDAAAALLLANRIRAKVLGEAELPFSTLLEFAGELGADVGPLLYREPVVQRDGEIRKTSIPDELKKNLLLLIKPPVGVSTAAAYLSLKRPYSENSLSPNPSEALENDFEVAVRDQDWFSQGVLTLEQLGANKTLLCGSGSSLVGFFSDAETVLSAAKEVKHRLKKWWVYQSAFCI